MDTSRKKDPVACLCLAIGRELRKEAPSFDAAIKTAREDCMELPPMHENYARIWNDMIDHLVSRGRTPAASYV